MSSAQNQCDINNLAGPDNLVVLDDGRVLIGEDTNKHESNMVWLWGAKTQPVERNENITLNYVNPVNTLANNDSTWDYKLQAEVGDLYAGSTYTAFFVLEEFGDGGVESLWLWNGIGMNGEQHEHMFSLKPGCYSVNASLYESEDLNSYGKNATLWSYATTDFTVGNGECNDGIYSEEVVELQEDTKDKTEEDVPGFGVTTTIIAALGAALITSRQKRRDKTDSC